MNVDWFFRIPYDVRVLAILLALAFGLMISCRPVVEWYRCDLPHLFFSFETHYDEGREVWVGFRQYLRAWTLRALSPEWTPDGAHIVFVAEGARKEFSTDERKIMSQVHVVGVDGSNLRTISDGSREYIRDHSPSVSPDGTRVAYSEYNRVSGNKRYEEIVTTALDGSERRRLTRKVGLDTEPEWLPDGDRIVFRRDPTYSCASRDPSIGGMYTIGSNRSNFWRITWEEEHQSGGGRYGWSPDGRQLAIIERPRSLFDGYNSQASLDVMDADGSNRRRLIDGKEWLSWPTWSPDGARIAFMRYKGSLITIDPESGDFINVADLPVHGSLSWSPDGSQIMVSDGYGTVYLVQADGTDVRLFSDVDASEIRGGLFAAWSPDGSRIAVVVPESSGVVLATVAPDGSDAKALVRRGENGELEAVGAARHEDGPTDIVGCVRTMERVYCLQVMNERLVVSSAMCAAAFEERFIVVNPRLESDCEALWATRRWATENRQPGQFERMSWEGHAPISDLSDLEERVVFEERFIVEEASLSLRVVELSLEGWNLAGPISGRLATELAKLTALESVDLSGNRLTGCIPEELRGKVTGYEEPEGCEG